MLLDWTARYKGLNLCGVVNEFISEPLVIRDFRMSNGRPFLQAKCSGVLPNGLGPGMLMSCREHSSISDLIVFMVASLFGPSKVVDRAVWRGVFDIFF